MNNLKYKQILYFISVVILLTLCVQGYWTYKNYESEKKQLMLDVQVCLDNALDSYYTNLAKQNTLSFITDSIPKDSIFMDLQIGDLLYHNDSLEQIMEKFHHGKDSSLQTQRLSIIATKPIDSYTIKADTPKIVYKNLDHTNPINPGQLEMLTSKIVVSFTEDTLSLGRIDSLLQNELKRKDLSLSYGLFYKNEWSHDQELYPEIIEQSSLIATAENSFLIDGSELRMFYDNITVSVLQRNTSSLFLSFLLASSIIFSLLYLLKIIQKQKELAEIKNDLISNITHEFKTPLATISVALEGIQRFNEQNDEAKSKKYAEMSKKEVEKLTLMVEKLLETATLASETLQLNLEDTNLVSLLEKVTSFDSDMLQNKTVHFHTKLEDCVVSIDRFHFENAINNILDNAIKYGGDSITVHLESRNKTIQLRIKDNGTELKKHHATKIFEKFYRVPKGNMHDVKGFGIGLYYTKNIIEKHQGTIELQVKNGTEFIIQLPHG